MRQLLELIDETAKDLVKAKDPERRKILSDEISTYAKIYIQIVIMRAAKEAKGEHY